MNNFSWYHFQSLILEEGLCKILDNYKKTAKSTQKNLIIILLHQWKSKLKETILAILELIILSYLFRKSLDVTNNAKPQFEIFIKTAVFENKL